MDVTGRCGIGSFPCRAVSGRVLKPALALAEGLLSVGICDLQTNLSFCGFNSAMNILLVEDDLDFGNGIRLALSDQGMHVIWVRRLTDAMSNLQTQVHDIVLLDLGLPDGDGITLLRHLRRNRETLPVLIMTARDALSDRLLGLDSGADDYLIKPFALAELLSRLRALARRSYGYEGETLELRGLALHEPTMRVTVAG